MRIWALASLAAFLLPLPMMADSVTYTYSGPDFTNLEASGTPQVPEPESLALVGTGLLGAAGIAQRA